MQLMPKGSNRKKNLEIKTCQIKKALEDRKKTTFSYFGVTSDLGFGVITPNSP